MGRGLSYLGWLIAAVLAIAAMAGATAWAGERDDRSSDVGAVDPCMAQHELTGRGCAPRGADRDLTGRTDDDEVADVDPCAAQYRMTGRACVSAETQDARRSRDASSRSVWRAGSVYPGANHDVFDACMAAHARLGGRCPYESRERVAEAESLPAEFFWGEGGVGGGIVDFGGGGGTFVVADSFANANASASASASARVWISVTGHKMHRWPHHGCGCRK
jgi:hypothetical protein